jgi:hypothetical protein
MWAIDSFLLSPADDDGKGGLFVRHQTSIHAIGSSLSLIRCRFPYKKKCEMMDALLYKYLIREKIEEGSLTRGNLVTLKERK